MTKYTNLHDLFTAIADAIRDKKGNTVEIIADDFPIEIQNIWGSSFPNGTEWAKCNGMFNHYIAYNANGIWVAGGIVDDGLYYSTDGKEWAQSNITSGSFDTVYNANGIWVAGGNSGLYYSTDGKEWTQSNITEKYLNTVYNANGIWVAGGRNLYYSVSWEP